MVDLHEWVMISLHSTLDEVMILAYIINNWLFIYKSHKHNKM